MKSLAELRPLPEEYRDNWMLAYQHWHVNPPTPIHISDMERLQKKAGITDRLIVSVLERGLNLRKPHAIAWAKKVIEGLVPYGITTVEEWQEFEAEQGSQAQNDVPTRQPRAFASLQRAMEKAQEEGEGT